MRTVNNPDGQPVSAIDHHHLTAHISTFIVSGDQDPVLPLHHSCSAQDAIPTAAWKA